MSLADVAGLAEPSLPAIITAVAAVVTAIGGVVVSVTVLIPLLRTSRETHKIVNQQRTDMQNWNRALIRALREHGIDVPRDQSVPDDDPPAAGTDDPA